MIDLKGKRVTIAGRLTGRYAGKGVKMLSIDLQRFLDAELVRDFDPGADVAIVGGDPERDLRRAPSMETIPETEIQRTLSEALARLEPPEPIEGAPEGIDVQRMDRD